MNTVDIHVINIIEPVWLIFFQKFCEMVLKDLGKENWSVSVVLCDDPFIMDINQKYRSVAKSTDVLSFPQMEKYDGGDQYHAGDIVISLPSMEQNAIENDVSKNNELKNLYIHGLLHLDGMDHENDSGEMLHKQEVLLNIFRGVELL